MQLFYTYLYLRPDGTPYYVGKGHGDRAYRTADRRVKGPADRQRILIQEHESEQDSFFTEKFLIALYGRKDVGTGILLNLTDGGEGASGIVPSLQSRMKKSQAMRKRPFKFTGLGRPCNKNRAKTAAEFIKLIETDGFCRGYAYAQWQVVHEEPFSTTPTCTVWQQNAFGWSCPPLLIQ